MSDSRFKVIFDEMKSADSMQIIKEIDEMNETFEEDERVKKLAEFIDNAESSQLVRPYLYTGT